MKRYENYSNMIDLFIGHETRSENGNANRSESDVYYRKLVIIVSSQISKQKQIESIYRG